MYNSSTLANRSARGSKSKKNFNKQASSQDLLDDYICKERERERGREGEEEGVGRERRWERRG